MQKETIAVLTSPVKVHYKPGPGRMKYKYVKGEDVIARLNAAFNHEWSSKVEQVFEKGNQVMVLISVEAEGVVHHGFGGAEIAVYKDGHRQGQPVDLSNNYKAAFTNALKKAAEQFGVGLEAEDDASLAEEAAPVTAPSPPSGVQTKAAIPPEAMKPVSGSIVMKSAPPEETNPQMAQLAEMLGTVDMGDVQAELRKLMGMQSPPSMEAVYEPKPEPKPESKSEPAPSLASNFANKSGYDPQTTRRPETENPFTPSGAGDEKVNDIQMHALGGLAKMKNKSAPEAISEAIPGNTKSSFEQLTRNEAKDVIQFLNKLRG